MKWVAVITSLALLILGGIITSLAISSTNKLGVKKEGNNVQIGFYDLLSQKKEIYDARIAITNGTVISTITNPNDNRFIFKGKFVRKPTKGRQLQYYYTPIFYNNPTSGRMVDGLMDYLTHNTIFITPIIADGQPMIYGQGGIFLDDPQKEK